MAYNIRQANIGTVANRTPVNPPFTFDVPVAELDKDGIYQVVMRKSDKKYVTAVDGVKILKLGYCCETKGHIYPIFLKMNGSWKTIFIGKEGMYETQPETFKDANDSESEETTSDVIITSVMVPAEIDFTLDYVVSTT